MRYLRRHVSYGAVATICGLAAAGLVGCSSGVAGKLNQPAELPGAGAPAATPATTPALPRGQQAESDSIDVPEGSAAFVSAERRAIVNSAVAVYAQTQPSLVVDSVAVADERSTSSAAVIRGSRDGMRVLIGIGVKLGPKGWAVESARLVATGGAG